MGISSDLKLWGFYFNTKLAEIDIERQLLLTQANFLYLDASAVIRGMGNW